MIEFGKDEPEDESYRRALLEAIEMAVKTEWGIGSW